MRKTLALAIACAMLASMSSVAFADTTTDTKTIKVDETSAIRRQQPVPGARRFVLHRDSA